MTKELVKAPESLSVWESNMKELRTRQPLLAGVLDEYVKENGHAFAHFETVTPAGRWIEGLTDEPFFEADKEPEFGWNRKKKEDRDKPVFFQYGIGVPPYLFKSIRALPDAALSLIVVEPSIPLLAYTLHLTHVYLALPGRCKLFFLTEMNVTEEEAAAEQAEQNQPPELVAPDAEQPTGSENVFPVNAGNKNMLLEVMRGALGYIGIYAAQLSVASGHAGEESVMKDDFIRLSREIRDWVSANLSYLGNSAEDTLLGVRQQVLLSHFVSFGSRLDSIQDKFKDYPVISVAAGPSLDKNFHLLKDIQDKCVIIAADAVLEKLLDNGIRPHIVTCLERVVLTYQVFFSNAVEKYRDECSKILLVAQSVTVPWVSGRWPGPVSVIGKMDSPGDEWLVGRIYNGSTMSSGSSVAHMNIVLSKLIGSSALAMIGQDLAYAESGESHAGAVGASWNYKTKRGDDTIELPGALGGTVVSNSIWLSFLKTIEELVNNFSINAWDCTEGGAKIDCAKTLPLADFIAEHAANMEPMQQTPAEIIDQCAPDIDREEVGRQIIGRMEAQYKVFDSIEALLLEIEELTERACAPGLDPKRRVSLAAEAGYKLDELHGKNAFFDFVGQSYTRLASIELSLTRSMDTVEHVNRWRVMHNEIIESHRSILSFLRRWLAYGVDVIKYYSAADDILRPLDSDEAWERLCELLPKLEAAATAEEQVQLRVAVNDLISRCDPIRLKWSGYILWTLAMFLMDEGRAALAVYFMQGAEQDFDGKEMPTDDIVAFLKDYARVLCASDLTHSPQPFHAEMLLSNAIELAGIDDEIKEIMSDVLDAEYIYLSISDDAFGGSSSGWYRDRGAVQRALYNGELDRALMLMWRAIQKHWRYVTGWAASHLDWLAITLERCRGAESPILAATVETILDEMAEADEVLLGVRITYHESFIEILEERGLKVPLLQREEAEPTKELEACDAEAAISEADVSAAASEI